MSGARLGGGGGPETFPSLNWAGQTTALWQSDTNFHWWNYWTAQDGQVPAASGTGSWTIKSNDKIMAVDFDGSGTDSLFIYNLTTATWGVLKWAANELQLNYLTVMGPKPPQPSGNKLVWVAAPGDEYFIVPNLSAIITSPDVPAGAAGLLLYNSTTLNMGLISCRSTAPNFVQWWITPPALENWNLAISRPPTNQFYGGNFAAAGKPSVVVFDPLDNYLSLLTWNGTNFSASPGQTTAGDWGFGNADQLVCADLDGDGITEILIYNSNYVGVLKWQNGSFGSLVVAHSSIGTAPNTWAISGNDTYYCLNGSNNNPGEIFAFSSNPLQMALLNYKDKGFVVKPIGSTLSPAWALTATDNFYIAHPWCSTTPALFTLSTQGPAQSAVPTLGAITSDGTTVQIASSATVPVLGWSPAFVAAAPHTAFSPFTAGDQGAIFTYISQLFPLPEDGKSTAPTNMRNSYTNPDDYTLFASFAGQIAAVTSPRQIPPAWFQPPANTWSDDDWTKVVQTIYRECIQVASVYGLYAKLGSLAQYLNGLQVFDLGTVQQSIDGATPSPTSSELDYWLGQSAVALLWGLAALGGVFFPGEELVATAIMWGMLMSVGASLLGSGLSYSPTQAKAIANTQVDTEIKNIFVSSLFTQSTQLGAFLIDPLKLQICGGLREGEWATSAAIPSTFPGAFQPIDRLWMYQQLMPFSFYLTVRVPTGPDMHPLTYNLNGVYYTLYGNGFISQSQFEATTLYHDLFVTIGVSLEDFLVGNGGWAAIPRTTVTSTNPG